MADGPADFPLIGWRRLRRSEQRGKPVRTVVLPRAPVRDNPTQHRQGVQRQADEAVTRLVAQRKAVGVEPQHLLVLEMEFVQASQIAILEKLGARILDEGEKRVPLAQPIWPVLLKFEVASDREAFAALTTHAELGISRLRSERGPEGAPHPLRLSACFNDKASADAFWGNTELPARHRFTVPATSPKKESKEIRHCWLVEFPDLATVSSFSSGTASTAANGLAGLTDSERANLFDAIDVFRALEPADRMGERLHAEGVPAKQEFMIDVDLWHPAESKQISAGIKAFRDMVVRHKGQVTDGPTAVAGTFFLARVKCSAETLTAILSYDRVAFADLPPKLPPVPSTIFNPVPLPQQGIPAAALDSPLACVVDSGVLAGHPLLQGWVLDERDFDSGDMTAVDLAGHGTHVAGIVVYGDIHQCVQDQAWEPKVRVLSAKVLRNNGGFAEFAEDCDERIETQLRKAITTFRSEYGCRVFNLSLGHWSRRYLSGRQLPWALVLDEVAREQDVVLVVSAGNVTSPAIPDATTEAEFRSKVLDQLLGDDHAIIDPASAMLALTVGSIARSEIPYRAYHKPELRVLVGSPAFGPSPFTRGGRLADTGAGPAKAVKPDLVAFGGNYYLYESGTWLDNDVLLGEPSLNLDFTNSGRLLKATSGTSVAAPFVTHICALVERELEQLPRWREKPPSANLIRALTIHSADIPAASSAWLGSTTDATERRMRLMGYGMPNLNRARRSSDERVVLIAEDELEDEFYHIYELDIPIAFAKLNSKRRIKVTLAYDPPVRGTRKEYLIRKLYFRLIKGATLDEIEQAAKQGKDCEQPDLNPSVNWIKDSTVQSAAFECTRPWTIDADAQDDSFTTWHLVVRSDPRLDTDEAVAQRYALVVSLEHGDTSIKLHNRVRTRVETRVKQLWG